MSKYGITLGDDYEFAETKKNFSRTGFGWYCSEAVEISQADYEDDADEGKGEIKVWTCEPPPPWPFKRP